MLLMLCVIDSFHMKNMNNTRSAPSACTKHVYFVCPKQHSKKKAIIAVDPATSQKSLPFILPHFHCFWLSNKGGSYFSCRFVLRLELNVRRCRGKKVFAFNLIASSELHLVGLRIKGAKCNLPFIGWFEISGDIEPIFGIRCKEDVKFKK